MEAYGAWAIGGALFGAGLLFGSFANVVIWRYPRGESLSFPSSHCPSCETPIARRDNVPVLSWLALRGRCRSCGEPISRRYPAVELASGALWLLAWVLFGASLRTAFAIAFLYLLLILSAIDIDTYRLPNRIVALLAGIGIAGAVFSSVSGMDAMPLLPSGGLLAFPLAASVAGGLSASGLALGIASLYAAARKREGFGMGDVKLLAAMGVFLGPYAVLVLFVGSVIGAGFGLALASGSDEGMGAKMPFGPFLALGAVLVLALGPAAWEWYVGLLV
jgi:leader peptidase (prepilin peptidase)/N-methyltransferase